jgi:hypothetical protein
MVDLEQLTPPGAVYSYCNSGFVLLGRLVEVITQQTFEAALQELVLTPLGLKDTFVFPELIMTRAYTVGHTGVREGRPRVLQPWHLPRASTPAGGIISTPGDLLRYACFHLGDGTALGGARLLTSNTLAAMRQPHVPATGLADRYVGLAWHLGVQNFNHSGRTYGQSAFLMLAPDHQLALCLLTNAPIGEEVFGRATVWVAANLMQLKRPERSMLTVSTDVLEECVGLYCAPTRDVEVGRLGDALVVREILKGGFPTRDSAPLDGPPPPLIRCAFYAHDRLVGLDPPHTEYRAEILRSYDGSVAFLRHAGRLHRRAT